MLREILVSEWSYNDYGAIMAAIDQIYYKLANETQGKVFKVLSRRPINTPSIQ